MSDITVIVVMYAYTLLVSFLLFRLFVFYYKLKGRCHFIIEFLLKISWVLFNPLVLGVIISIGNKAESQDNGAWHSIICMIIYMFAFVYALAKNDPRAHEKISFRFKKKDK